MHWSKSIDPIVIISGIKWCWLNVCWLKDSQTSKDLILRVKETRLVSFWFRTQNVCLIVSLFIFIDSCCTTKTLVISDDVEKKTICNDACCKSWQNLLYFISCAWVSTSDVNPDVPECVDSKKKKKRNLCSPRAAGSPPCFHQAASFHALNVLFWRGSRFPLCKIKTFIAEQLWNLLQYRIFFDRKIQRSWRFSRHSSFRWLNLNFTLIKGKDV